LHVSQAPAPWLVWTRWLLMSATKTFLLPSTAAYRRAPNCLSPLPLLPHFVAAQPAFCDQVVTTVLLRQLLLCNYPIPGVGRRRLELRTR
jgi:hypothetical protein